MPTARTPAKTKTKPKSAAPRKPRSPQAAAARSRKPATPAAPALPSERAALSELLARLGKLELAGLAGRLVSGWRTDLETLVQANRRSYAGLQQMVTRQMAALKEHVGEIQAVAKVMRDIGPKESVRHLDELALGAVEMALADVRELAEAAAQSQREAFELVQQRVNANIDEVRRLLRKKADD